METGDSGTVRTDIVVGVNKGDNCASGGPFDAVLAACHIVGTHFRDNGTVQLVE